MPLFLNTGAIGGGGLGGLVVGDSTLSSGSARLSNSNGLQFGINGSVITGSYNGLTSQSNQALSGSNGSFTFQTATFGSSNGMHFYTTNGSLVGSYTVPTQTNQTLGLYASSNTTAAATSTTVDARSLSVRGMGVASVGYSGGELIVSVPAGGGGITAVNLSGGTTSNNLTAFVLSNSNNVSFGMNGSTVTATATFAQSNQAVSAANGSYAFQTLSFSNANGISFGTSAGSAITGSYTVPVVPAQSNQTLGLYASSNTTGAASSTTVDARTLSVRGAGVASVGYSGGELVISVPAGGGAAPVTFNSTVFGKQLEWGLSSSSLAQNNLHIFPEILQNYVSGAVIKVPVMITNSSSASNSVQNGLTIRFGVYTRNATNSTVLTQHYSTSYTLAASHSSNVSWRMSIITAVGNSTSYNSTTVNSAGINLSSSLHGAREFIMPYSTLMTPGEYWLAYVQSSSSAGAVGNVLRVSNLIQSSVVQNRLGVVPDATNDGIARNIGMGIYSVTTGGLPNGISMNQILIAGTQPVYYFLSATV